jgi:hypothetical protein
MKAVGGSVLPVEESSLSWEDEEAGTIAMKGQHGDAAIWQFLGDEGRSRIVFQLQRQGIRTLMEVDDNYLYYAPPLYGKSGAWARTHREAVANGTGYSVEYHRKQAPMVDGIICATDNLANAYDAFNDNVYVCPNSIDPSDWNVEREESDKLRIGYYGSVSHVRDYPLVKKALKWAARQEGVEVIMLGFRPPGWGGPSLPWSDDLFEGRKLLGKIDVGIAPLTRNRWADGKSDLKALEYAMAGVMPIVQDAPPYHPWKDAGWQWVAETEQDWNELIREVVKHRDNVPVLAHSAKDYVLDNRTIDKNKHLWEEALRGT